MSIAQPVEWLLKLPELVVRRFLQQMAAQPEHELEPERLRVEVVRSYPTALAMPDALLALGPAQPVVHDVPLDAVDPVGEDLQSDPDLRGGQAHAADVGHRLLHVPHEPPERVVEVHHLVGGGAQHRVADLADGADRHSAGLPTRPVSQLAEGGRTSTISSRCTTSTSTSTRRCSPASRATPRCGSARTA